MVPYAVFYVPKQLHCTRGVKKTAWNKNLHCPLNADIFVIHIFSSYTFHDWSFLVSIWEYGGAFFIVHIPLTGTKKVNCVSG